MDLPRPIVLAVAIAISVTAACGSDRALRGSTATTLAPASLPSTTSLTAPRTTTTVPTATTRPTTTTTRPTTTVPAPATTGAKGPAALITRGRTDRKVVALTFDAGSDAGNAARILATLAANHIPATFGLTGLWAQANPALVRQIAAGGNQIVDHSWDHRSFTGYSTKTAPLTASEIKIGRAHV